jgi:DNA-binding beta-propeller fold protein YncE
MLPADWRYWEDAGFGGSPMVLQMTDFGLLHGTACAGVGLALLNLETGTDTPIGPDMLTFNGPSEGYGRIALSPDGQKFAAVYTSYSEPELTRTLAIIDLATLAVTDVKVTGTPQQIAWGKDGTLFYSTITPTTNLVDTLTADEQKALGDLTAMELRDNVVEIHQVNPATGDDIDIYQADGYAIGRLAATADGQGLVFSQVANVDAWVKAIADGTLDINTDIDGTAQRALVPITLYRLNLGGDKAATSLGDDLTQFTLQPQTS